MTTGLVAVAVGCSTGDEAASADGANARAAQCALPAPARMFEPGEVAVWRGLDTASEPSLDTARWMAWLSGASYADDFGDVVAPGYMFLCGFHRMGFGDDRKGKLDLSGGPQKVYFSYSGEGDFWWKAGQELKRLVAVCPWLSVKSDACAMRDALERELFTQLPPSREIGKLHGQSLKGTKHFAIGTTQAFFLHDPHKKQAVIAFRGTQATVTQDVLADLDISAHDIGRGVMVHSGFYSALHERTDVVRNKNASQLLLDRLDELPEGTQLFVTGHSLGGALATLFTYEVLESPGAHPYRLTGLYTFGSPALGNEAFATRLNADLKARSAWHGRFTHGRDIVPESTFYVTNRYVHNTGYEGIGGAASPRSAQAINLYCDGARGKGYDLTEDRPAAACSSAVGDHSIARYYAVLANIVRNAKARRDLRIDRDPL